MRLVLPSAAVAAIALTAGMTQAANTLTQQTAQQAADRVSSRMEAAYNRHDAAAIAALFTPDATFVPARPSPRLGSVITGRQAIEQFFADDFGTFPTVSHKLVEVHPIDESSLFLIGELHLTGQRNNQPLRIDGHFTDVLVRVGDDWQIRVTATSAAPGPAATQASGATR